jgi:hypothetical protein
VNAKAIRFELPALISEQEIGDVVSRKDEALLSVPSESKRCHNAIGMFAWAACIIPNYVIN